MEDSAIRKPTESFFTRLPLQINGWLLGVLSSFPPFLLSAFRPLEFIATPLAECNCILEQIKCGCDAKPGAKRCWKFTTDGYYDDLEVGRILTLFSFIAKYIIYLCGRIMWI